MPPIKKQVRFSRINPVDLRIRPVVSVSMGCHIDGLGLPHADPYDPYTTLAGVCKRAATATPKPNSLLLQQLKTFVHGYVQKHFKPLPADVDLSFETWIEQTSYPLWRKEELRKVWSSVSDPFENTKYVRNKCFMKDEKYTEIKYARGIYSRHDVLKCFFGPVFKAIETVVYKHWPFIKHVPVAERPNYILRKLGFKQGKIVATDYTAFESLFTKEIMEAVEFVLYEFMLQNVPNGLYYVQRMREVLAGINHCEFKRFWFEVFATRMSGEMNTSLGNGFSNLMFMLFACHFFGSKGSGVVEGDDGLFVISGPIPTSEFFKALGLNIKLEVHEELSTASFCGIVFDVIDRINIRDPMKVLLSFGWCNGQYVNAKDSKLKVLLRCKALSLIHQYPGCPIISELGFYALRMTSKVTVFQMVKVVNTKLFDSYERSEMLRFIHTGIPEQIFPGIRSRMLMEKLYGVTCERQLMIEQMIKIKKDLRPFDSDLFYDYVHKDQILYSLIYLMEKPSDDRCPPIVNRSTFNVVEIDNLIKPYQKLKMNKVKWD